MINFKESELKADLNIDASMYAIFAFEVFDADDLKVVNTMDAIKDKLWCKSDSGGLARYQNDYYHQVSRDIDNIPGNPWFICTLWLAEYEIARAWNLKGLKKGLDLLKWVSSHSLNSGVLAEQVDPVNNKPISVSPLTWSHATYVMTILKYLKKKNELRV